MADAYAFNPDRSKAPVYTKEEIDQIDLVNDQALQQEISDRVTAVSTVNNRVSTILAEQDLDPNKDSELIDIRLGYDGFEYPVAGDAVRNQLSDVFYTFEKNMIDIPLRLIEDVCGPIENKSIANATGPKSGVTRSDSNKRLSSDFFQYAGKVAFTNVAVSDVKVKFYEYDSDGTYLHQYGMYTESFEMTFVQGHYYMFYTYHYTDSLAISVQELNAQWSALQSDYKDIIDKLSDDRNTVSYLNMNSVNDVDQLVESCDVSFLHFSDPHGDSQSVQRILDYIEDSEIDVDAVICTGDLVDDYYHSSALDWWNNILGTENILTCIGNHDAYSDSKHHSLPQTDQYAAFFEPYASSWGVTIPTDKTYWYKDFGSVRVVSLNVMLTGSEVGSDRYDECLWLENVLSDAITNEKSVAIITHYPCNEKIESNFTDKDFNKIDSYIGYQFHMKVRDFVNNGGEFICYLSGHTHADIITRSNSYQAISLNISVASSSIARNFGCDERLPSGKSLDAFNIVGFDLSRKLIKIVRIGSDRDAYMNHRGTICIDFQNQSIINFD